MNTILLTGATGFIGSNIASTLIEHGFDVYATYRTTSSFEKCKQFESKVKWINVDKQDWKENIKRLKPMQLIHAAWGGIEASSRNNWNQQINNFWFSKELFDLAKEAGIRKVIALGSQAEYGAPGHSVDEEASTNPEDAYGAVKLLTANYMQQLFQYTLSEWYWIRVFSFFGEGESQKWLIPMVISKLLKQETIKLTLCEQRYNYLYIKDFTKQILKLVNCEYDKSGIYNLCNSEPVILKEFLIKITEIMETPQELLAFGEIPYRPRQNMLITGNNLKFHNSFNSDKVSYELTAGLINTIEYYKKKL